MSLSLSWEAETEERSLLFPCDRYIKDFDVAYYRGINIHAGPEIIFRWLCQMRVAPYSYDWIDNLGRRSPQMLINGLDKLSIGQQIMTIFELVEFENNRHLTIRAKQNRLALIIFGNVVGSYLIVPQTKNCCRLLVKLVVKYPMGPVGWFMRVFLPWGDLIMMRRQLLNFKRLSEQMSNSS